MQTLVSAIFSDKSKFQLDYVPSQIRHRDEQISKIRDVLIPDLEQGVRPRNILCVGSFGTGKTAVTLSICHTLPERVVSCYVNCSEQNTANRIIRSALRILGVPVKPGFSSDHYLDLFKNAVAQARSLILILDEVDKLIERKNSDYEDLFYTLSRSVTNVVVILLTNRVSLETTILTNLDSRTRDTFRLLRVEFGDYDAMQLGDILKDRCRIGLNESAYDAGIIASIARVAYRNGMRARGVIDLTRKAGEIAEFHGHPIITLDDVQAAEKELTQQHDMEIIQHLPPPTRAILGYVSTYSPTSSIAYEWYRKYAPINGWGESNVTFHGYLKELETMGLVRKEKHGLGRGRGIQMRLITPPELSEIIKSSLGTLTHTQFPNM